MEYVQRLLMRLFLILVIMFAVENGCNGCWEKERFALLQIKDSINFPNGTSLPSWEEDDYLDCCQWEGVQCHPTTRRVIKLSLNDTRDWRLDDYWYLNASVLLPFESLRSLDLSINQLRGFVGNEGLGILSNLRNLEDLDLGDNYLDNSILASLNKLSNLKILNLAWNILNGSISIDELDGLKNLKELDLGGNNFSSINELDGLKNLKKLDLSSNRIVTANGLGILSNLEDLDLGDNELDNSILPSLNKLSNLKILNFPGNKLNGSISIDEFDGLKNLKELDLGGNNISSIIIANGSQEKSGILTELEVLDLSGNSLNDSIWSFVGELSSIKTLYLRYINADLHGPVRNLTNLGCIENLFMDGVNILDEFLGSIRFMTSIQVLSLRECALDGILPITGGGVFFNGVLL